MKSCNKCIHCAVCTYDGTKLKESVCALYLKKGDEAREFADKLIGISSMWTFKEHAEKSKKIIEALLNYTYGTDEMNESEEET